MLTKCNNLFMIKYLEENLVPVNSIYSIDQLEDKNIDRYNPNWRIYSDVGDAIKETKIYFTTI